MQLLIIWYACAVEQIGLGVYAVFPCKSLVPVTFLCARRGR